MSATRQLVIFLIDEWRFGLDLAIVERVVRAAEVTPLPDSPDVILGVLKVEGRVIPVFNLRKRLGMPEREMELSDQMIIAHASPGPVVLVVDEVTGLLECDEEAVVPAQEISQDIRQIKGVAKTAAGMVMIQDLEMFLLGDEPARLREALNS